MGLLYFYSEILTLKQSDASLRVGLRPRMFFFFGTKLWFNIKISLWCHRWCCICNESDAISKWSQVQASYIWGGQCSLYPVYMSPWWVCVGLLQVPSIFKTIFSERQTLPWKWWKTGRNQWNLLTGFLQPWLCATGSSPAVNPSHLLAKMLTPAALELTWCYRA